MEYMAVLLALAFGFIFGRILGRAEMATLERQLNTAVNSGKVVRIIIDNKGMRTELKNGRLEMTTFDYEDE